MLNLANLTDEQQIKAEDDYLSYVRVGGENTLPRWPLQNPPLVAGSKSPRRQQENNLLTIRSEIQAYSFFILNFLSVFGQPDRCLLEAVAPAFELQQMAAVKEPVLNG
jgi:hypothetical protein